MYGFDGCDQILLRARVVPEDQTRNAKKQNRKKQVGSHSVFKFGVKDNIDHFPQV